MAYSEKFVEAFLFAEENHRNQTRKGTDIPYITHLMAVAAIVAEYGGDESQAIAGLLHDLLEDTPIAARQIEQRFGEATARMVVDLSDTVTSPKPPWRERKEKYIRHLDECNLDSLLVSVADKLHNALSIVRDVKLNGKQVWNRFNASAAEIIWYNRSMLEVFEKRLPGLLVDEYAQAVREMARLAGQTM